MPDFALPFPTRELAQKELSCDPCYEKIPIQDRPGIVNRAWEKGASAAREVFAREGGSRDFLGIVQRAGLKCVFVNVDYVVGKQRYFSDYLSGRGEIRLYRKSIALWAEQNNLTQEQAVNVILSHEFFHYLEWTKLGLTSREYTVPMVTLGKWSIGKTGIRALSEIGAHGFARTYYELERKEEAHDEGAAI